MKPFAWDDFPEAPGEWLSSRKVLRDIKTPEVGERMILDENFFVEQRLPARIMRQLSEKEMVTYRAPFREPGEARLPTLVMPRDAPIGGDPADVEAIVTDYGAFLQTSPIPKLFIRAEPGGVLRDHVIDFCRSFPNQTEVSVRGIHYVQEDSPHDIGRASAQFIAALPE